MVTRLGPDTVGGAVVNVGRIVSLIVTFYSNVRTVSDRRLVGMGETTGVNDA